MIRCEECKEWYMYHGKCVKVTQEEEEAEAVGDFVCSGCHRPEKD
jgi:hypothetical protein